MDHKKYFKKIMEKNEKRLILFMPSMEGGGVEKKYNYYCKLFS